MERGKVEKHCCRLSRLSICDCFFMVVYFAIMTGDENLVLLYDDC